MKKIAILGSTGSIGTQTLEVARNNGDLEITALAAGSNIKKLEEQIREFHPKTAAVWSEEKAGELRTAVRDLDVRIVSGMEGLIEVCTEPEAEIVVTAIVGMIGIVPTIAAMKAGKDIALANKETLVTAGHIIIPLAEETGVKILPVDSEHSAIFQCLNGESRKELKKILLTASGGPFRGKKREELRIIVCHLGNGASVSAVCHGKSIDTSMGLTPLEGLIMGTRSGDMDPAIVGFLAEKEDMSASEVINVCNKRSGVLGLSGGLSSDFRDLAQAAADGNKTAETALEAYAYRVGKYIGAYAAAMNGVDVIAFTAGVGENNAEVRQLIAQYIGFLGTSIDPGKNRIRGEEVILSAEGDRVVTMVVPTDEELAIARETVALVEKR